MVRNNIESSKHLSNESFRCLLNHKQKTWKTYVQMCLKHKPKSLITRNLANNVYQATISKMLSKKKKMNQTT